MVKTMKCLVPLDTADPDGGNNPFPAPIPTAAFTITQNLAAGLLAVTQSLAAYGFAVPPQNIIATILAANDNEPNISLYGLQWSATNFSANISSPTPDASYVLKLQIFP